MNRLSTVDARLIAVGQVVHSDPMMWGAAGGAEAVAQQIYSGWFAVPQISMPLSALSEVQATALRGLLTLWRDLAAITLGGTIDVRGAERGYDLVRAVHAESGRSVIARYAPVVVDLDDATVSKATIINATSDARLVLRTTRPITDGVVRSAAATVIIASVAPTGFGLVEIDVPAFGSVTVRIG